MLVTHIFLKEVPPMSITISVYKWIMNYFEEQGVVWSYGLGPEAEGYSLLYSSVGNDFFSVQLKITPPAYGVNVSTSEVEPCLYICVDIVHFEATGWLAFINDDESFPEEPSDFDDSLFKWWLLTDLENAIRKRWGRDDRTLKVTPLRPPHHEIFDLYYRNRAEGSRLTLKELAIQWNTSLPTIKRMKKRYDEATGRKRTGEGHEEEMQ